MTDLFFNSPDELKEAFGIDNLPGYENYIPFKDRKVGFSVQRQYPPDIRYKPPKRKDGTPDTVALIRVLYFHPTEVNEPVNPGKVPLSLSISTHSRYLINHFEYNFDDDNCPTRQSISLSKSTPRPIALDSKSEYFYDHHNNSFINNRSESLKGKEVLDRIFQLHCNTIHVVKGRRLRW